MGSVSAALLVYSLQIAALVAVAALVMGVLRPPLPGVRLAFWRSVGALCLLMPLASLLPPDVRPVAADLGTAGITGALATVEAATSQRGVDPIPWLWLAGLGAHLGWLGLGALRLREIRRTSSPAALGDRLDALRASLAPRAEVRWSGKVSQPVCFGVRRPAVFLPRRFAELGSAEQEAVVCHELLHVARRDWPWTILEELMRSVFWFHPGAWWVLDRIRLNREQLIDQLVAARVGSRKDYMRALVSFADGDALSPSLPFGRRRQLVSRLRQLSEESRMSRTRLVATVTVLAAVMSGAAMGVLAAMPLPVPGQQSPAATTRLEVRLAESEPGEGLVEVVVAGREQPIFLHAEPVVTGADVASAQVREGDGADFSIEVVFRPDAAARMAEATRSHIDRPMAILVDGEVVSAPTVRSAVRDRAVITGDFTREEAEALAVGLGPASER
jgi:beta-lactamase regulating signal transducer with metallopeptidase domain